MKLYHGTTAYVAQRALEHGLTPRGRRKTNWQHAPSHPRAVYLTNAYALHFALCATQENVSDLGIIEIDSDKLNPGNLVPDEDCLEQVGRGRDDIPGNMSIRTAYYRNRLADHVGLDNHEISLKALGNCAHMGKIPVDAITRVAVFDWQENKPLVYASDPSISLMNYSIMGPYYRNLTRLIFDPPGPEFEPGIQCDRLECLDKQINRDAIEIITRKEIITS